MIHCLHDARHDFLFFWRARQDYLISFVNKTISDFGKLRRRPHPPDIISAGMDDDIRLSFYTL